MTDKVSSKTRHLKVVALDSKSKDIRKTKKKLSTKLTLEDMRNIVTNNREHGQRLAWRFLKGWRVRLRPDEVNSIVGLALTEAANRFNPSKEVAFQTFFFYHLRGLLLKEITRLVNEAKMCDHFTSSVASSDEAPEHLISLLSTSCGADYQTPEVMMYQREIALLCWNACTCLDELEREVIFRHFSDDQSLNEIATELGYCRCHISRVKGRAMAKLQSVVRGSSALTELILGASKAAEEMDHSAVGIRGHYTGGRGRRKIDSELKKSSKIDRELKRA